LGVRDSSVFTELEQSELQQPSPRKVLSDRVIYRSQPMPVTDGPPVLCDFGAARIGKKHKGDVMPFPYRAPEVILDMEWDLKVDVWSLGVMVCLFTGSLAPLTFPDMGLVRGWSTISCREKWHPG
jgi:serine/threonine protein kinase